MENEEVVTPEGQDEKNVSFDDNGEMKFSEKGLESFKELLKVEEEPEEEIKEPEEEPEKPKTEKPEKKETKTEEKFKVKIDGQEEELTKDQLIEYAQKGKDYTRKTQQLAEERNALAPYEALLQQLKTDPKLSQHIAEYWQKPTQKAPQSDDPVEQLKQEILEAAEKKIQEAITPLARQTTLQRIQQQIMTDPDYNVVHGKIIEYVKNQPPAIQKTLFLQLDQDPNAYLEMFAKYKEELASNKKEPTPPKEIPEPVKKTERAPILETSNTAPAEDGVVAQKTKIDKAKAKALKSGSVDALQEYLQAGGFLEHLT